MLVYIVFTYPDTKTYFMLPMSNLYVPFLAIARGKEKKQSRGRKAEQSLEKFSARVGFPHSANVESNTTNGYDAFMYELRS